MSRQILLALSLLLASCSRPPETRKDQQQAYEEMRQNLRPLMSLKEFYDVKWKDGTPIKDKNEDVSVRHAQSEFKISDTIGREALFVNRFLPFEAPSGPAYRVNVLWGSSEKYDTIDFLNHTRILAIYFRSPN